MRAKAPHANGKNHSTHGSVRPDKKSARPRPGIAFERHFTGELAVAGRKVTDPLDAVTWERRSSVINNPDGSVVFKMEGAEIPAGWAHAVLPPENATMFPAAGDVILAYVPPRAWGGVPHAIFDIGLFYAPGGRLLLPVGWVAGSLVAQVVPEDLAGLRRACEAIRRSGACTVTVEALA